jgi:hypothetical protein
MWKIDTLFSRKGGRHDPTSRVELEFQTRSYVGAVVGQARPNGRRSYRLWFDEELRIALAQTFVMSNMRDLEGRLQSVAGQKGNVEQDIPFWEFLDIEFNRKRRQFLLTAYYPQKPSFPLLFHRMAGAPALKRIRDEIAGKSPFRIHKQEWRPRDQFELEIGATNVIYMLTDSDKRLVYVGETDDLVSRLSRGHVQIPDWDFYRYDALPAAWAPYRLQIERMLIFDVEQLLNGFPGIPVPLRLVNVRVDRTRKHTVADGTPSIVFCPHRSPNRVPNRSEEGRTVRAPTSPR